MEGVSIGALRAYLTNALIELRDKYSDNKQIMNDIYECSIILTTPNYDSINECIDKVATIINKLGLKAP